MKVLPLPGKNAHHQTAQTAQQNHRRAVQMLSVPNRPHLVSVSALALLAVGCARESTAPLAPELDFPAGIVQVSSTYLIDTGPAGTTSTSSSSLFSDSPTFGQYLGGKFTLASDANVESV